MNLSAVILQILLVAGGAFAFSALLLSYFRYRAQYLQSFDQIEEGLTVPAAGMLVLHALRERKEGPSLMMLHVEAVSSVDSQGLCDFLKKNTRKRDMIYQLRERGVLLLLYCPEENLPMVGRRLIPLLQQAGFERGCIRMRVPDFDVKAFESWLKGSAGNVETAQWELHPEEWKIPEDSDFVSGVVDPLTGVLEAGRVPRALRRIMADHGRKEGEITLVCVDVDELDSYNETFGRDIGDRILKQTATLLMDHCRESDLIGRLEEDAFILVMPGTKEEIQKAVQRISDVIKSSSLEDDENVIRFSASFGLVTFPGDGKNPVVLMERAGLALQEAKNRGRGLCVAYQPSLAPPKRAGTADRDRSETF